MSSKARARGVVSPGTGAPGFWSLLRPHWIVLLLALLAAVGETLADVLQPWPIKIVIDNIVDGNPLPRTLGRIVLWIGGGHAYATLNFAVAMVAAVAIVGAVSSYWEKYLTTSVSQWVGHDLRRLLYQQIQRLSLAEHSESQSGDLLSRMSSDIGAIQDFINSALLGILVNAFTLAGMIGVMLYNNWRFTLLALSVAPILFLVVYFYTRRIKKASRAVRKKETELLASVSDVLTSIHVVQAFARASRSKRASPPAAPRPSSRRSSRSSSRSARAWCLVTVRASPSRAR